MRYSLIWFYRSRLSQNALMNCCGNLSFPLCSTKITASICILYSPWVSFKHRFNTYRKYCIYDSMNIRGFNNKLFCFIMVLLYPKWNFILLVCTGPHQNIQQISSGVYMKQLKVFLKSVYQNSSSIILKCHWDCRN